MALNDEKKAAYVAEGYTGPISEAEHNFLVANPRGSWIQYITSLQDAGYTGPVNEMERQYAAAGYSTGDASFANVMLLSGFEGVDAATTFTDESGVARTLTAVAQAQVDTAQFKYGVSSALFDGTGDYIQAADSADLSLTNQDFTIEGWVRYAGTPGTTKQVLASHWLNTGNLRSWALQRHDASTARFNYSANGTAYVSADFTFNSVGSVWYHIALCRDGANLRFFVNGTQGGATHDISTTSLFDSTDVFRIGAYNNSGISNVTNGWIDDFRLTIGTARYTANFTAPSTAFPRA